MVIALVTGVLVSVISAALPARKAAQVPPVDAMTESAGGKEKPLRLRLVLGVAFIAIGIAGLSVAATTEGDLANVALAIGAATLLLGALVVAPAVIGVVARVLAWPFVRIGRPVVALARGNVTRNPRRSANTASALMIGMALVGAAATLAASTESSVSGIVDESVKADFILRGATYEIPVGAVDAAETVPGVSRFDRFDYGPAVVDGTYTYLSGAEPGFFDEALTVTTIDGDVTSLDAGDAVASQDAAEANGWAVGDELTITSVVPGADGVAPSRTVTVGGIFTSQSLGVELLVPMDVLRDTVAAQSRIIDTVFVRVADGADPAQVRADLVKAVEPYYVVSVQDRAEFTASIVGQVKQILNVLYALLALSIVIAVLGIVNTLALSIMERTKEIGLERAVGLGRLQLAGVTVIESVLIALFGTVLGLGVGVGIAAVLPRVYQDSGLSELAIPWGQLMGMLVLSVIVGVLAALWPAIRAARLPVLESIATD